VLSPAAGSAAERIYPVGNGLLLAGAGTSVYR
jgi:hypothetical protein